MAMLDRLLNQVNILEKGLDASWLKNDVIAGNIANADTPGYKSRSVDFESVFADALADAKTSASSSAQYRSFLDEVPDQPASSPEPAGRSSRLSGLAAGDLDVSVSTNEDTTLRMDRNNVDIDYEMTELAKNAVMYDTMSYAAAKELGRLKLIINEGK